MLLAHDGVFPLEKLMGEYTVGRYTGVIENQSGPFWYYLPVIILGFFPWIAFLPGAVASGIDRLRRGNENGRLLRLALVWSVVPLLFFSIARTKLPNYVALEFPALALLAAFYFDAVVRRGVTRSAVISAATVPVTIGALAFAIWLFTRNNRLASEIAHAVPPLCAMGAAIFIGSLVTAVLLARARSEAIAPYALAVAAIVATDLLGATMLPKADAFKPIPRLASIIQTERRQGDAVAIEGVSGGNALLFYTRPVVHVLTPPNDGDPQSEDDPRAIICGSPRAWVVVPAAGASADPSYGRSVRVIAVDRKAALLLYNGPHCGT